jgi:hypothetical protein
MRGTLQLSKGFHSVYFCHDVTAMYLVNSQNLIIRGEFNNKQLIEMFIRFLSVNEKNDSFPIPNCLKSKVLCWEMLSLHIPVISMLLSGWWIWIKFGMEGL